MWGLAAVVYNGLWLWRVDYGAKNWRVRARGRSSVAHRSGGKMDDGHSAKQQLQHRTFNLVHNNNIGWVISVIAMQCHALLHC